MQDNSSSSIQKNSLEKEYHIESVYSWDIFSDTQISKNIDKSALSYNGSGIPVEIRSFFNVESLLPGESKTIILCHEEEDYEAYIEMEKDEHQNRIPRTRMFWEKKLGEIIREFCKLPEGAYELRFIKSQIQKNYYYLKLVESISIHNSYQLLLHNTTAPPDTFKDNKRDMNQISENISDLSKNMQPLESDKDIKDNNLGIIDKKQTQMESSHDPQSTSSYSQERTTITPTQLSNSPDNLTQKNVRQREETICLQILEKFFPFGINLENRLQVQKYVAYYSQYCQEHPEITERPNPNIQLKQIQQYSISCGDDLWMAPASLCVSEDLRNSIISTIKTLFENKEIIASFEEIYNQYKSELSQTNICDGMILGQYISRYLYGNYFYLPPYVSPFNIEDWPVLISEKILEKIESYGDVVTYEQLILNLPHVPVEAIDQVLQLPEIIGRKRNSYTHIRCFDITQTDKRLLSDLLKANMENGVITTSHLFELYSKANPEFFERNHISEIRTLIDITRYYFPDEFSYGRGKISLKGIYVPSATEQVISYLRSLPKFTYQDLEQYRTQHHYNVAVMSVLLPLLTKYRYLRLNEEEFISSDLFQVSQEIIDEISVLLENELSSGYFCSDTIKSYLPYPFINQHPLTPYLLESLIRLYGNQFKPALRIIDYYSGGKKPRGIILRTDSLFQSHEEVLIDVMRKRNKSIPFENSDDALQYLKESKYLDREPRGGIEKLYRVAIE